jgi:predicted lipid-binding transport protein (Tim44 family)
LIVTVLNRRFRGMTIALVVLGLSAGAVLAARPASAPVLPDQAANQAESPKPSESPEASESAEPTSEASESPEASEAAKTSVEAASGVHPDNHGKLVSEAAQSSTPPGFANHGQYVRTIAQANHGNTVSTTAKTHGK